jgi:DeoR/GlpR family transcriptional regulator of sugar metabolism
MQTIEGWLNAEGRLEVVDVAARLEVAPETIRRDLRTLESAGRLQRVHGGAVSLNPEVLTSVSETTSRGAESDHALAAEVWGKLPRTGTILLGAGSLNLALARVIAAEPPETPGLTIVTNFLDAALVLSRTAHLSVYNIGGAVSPTSRAQEGDWALSELNRLHTDVSVICPAGISIEYGLSQSSSAAAAVSQAEVSSGERVIALCEAQALGRPSFARFAGIAEIDELAVSGTPAVAALQAFLDRGVSVSVADDLVS